MADTGARIAAAVMVAASVALWGAMLGLSGILSIDWLSASKAAIATPLLFSPFTIGFALLFPLTFGLIAALCRNFEKKEVYISALPAALIGLIALFATAGFSTKIIFFGLLTLPAIVLTIETCFLRLAELKKLVAFRAGMEGAKKGFLVFTLGVLLIYGSAGFANNSAYAKDFLNTINSKIGGSVLDSSTLADAAAEQQLQTQKLAMIQMINSEQFAALRQSSAPQDVAYVAWVDASLEALESPAAKEQLIRQIKQSGALEKAKIDTTGIIEKIPAMKQLLDFYWLLATLGIITVFTFYTNLIAGLLAGAYAVMADALLAMAFGRKEENE